MFSLTFVIATSFLLHVEKELEGHNSFFFSFLYLLFPLEEVGNWIGGAYMFFNFIYLLIFLLVIMGCYGLNCVPPPLQQILC